MRLALPVPSLVVLVGASGCGKSTFARAHFKPTEVVSSDHCRALVCDDEGDQSATEGAFAVLHLIAEQRLLRGRVTVVDATNVTPRARRPLLELARRHDLPAVAVVFDLPEELCEARSLARAERIVAPAVVRRQWEDLQRALPDLEREGFRQVIVFTTPDDIAAAAVMREPLPVNRRHDRGPFDIVGDVHGCGDELDELLEKLGYVSDAGAAWRHDDGRRVIFLGDLVDRGPRVADVLAVAMRMAAAGTALCLPGNDDAKLARALRGHAVRVPHGMQPSLEQLAKAPEELRARVADFIDGMPSHYVLDSGRLVVAHAGMKRELQGRDSRRVTAFALYGDTTGETDEHGLPVRRDWAAAYGGRAIVVYGHTPVADPVWVNRTINIDTGCVFGRRLTALRYPALELVAVPARRSYAVPARPVQPASEGAPPH